MGYVVTNGLIFAYDSANRRTYRGDGGGTSSTDLVGGLTGTLTNILHTEAWEGTE